jgi:hypothetical protein
MRRRKSFGIQPEEQMPPVKHAGCSDNKSFDKFFFQSVRAVNSYTIQPMEHDLEVEGG